MSWYKSHTSPLNRERKQENKKKNGMKGEEENEVEKRNRNMFVFGLLLYCALSMTIHQ